MPLGLSPPRRRILLAAILLVALGLRLWGITWGLHNADVSRRAHPDEWVMYWLFQWFGSTGTLNPCPSYPHQCFFDWGMAYPYLAYGVHLLLLPLQGLIPGSFYGPRGDHAFVNAVLAGRITAALLSTATVYVVYRIAYLAFNAGAALLGALLVACSGLLFQLAHFATPDSATLFFMALALFCCARIVTAPTARNFLLAGGAIGLAAGSEFHMALLFAPLAVSWWLGSRRRIVYLPLAAGTAAVVFLAINAYILIDAGAFWQALEHTLRIRTVDSTVQYDDRWAPYAPAILYVIRFPLGYGVGFLLAAWMIAGVIRAFWSRARFDLLLLSWIVPYFVLVTAEPAKFMRYSAPLLIPLGILAGRLGLEAVRTGIPHLRLTVALAGTVALLYTGSYDLAYAGMFSSQDPRQTASSWIVAHDPGRQAVGYEVIPDGLLNLPFFLPSTVHPCFSQFRLDRLQGSRFVVLDSYTPEEQPAPIRARLARFQRGLTAASHYRLVDVIHSVPTFFGLRFSIDASPHDWRYPSHEITIYERPGATIPSPFCYPNIAAATRALYVAPSRH